MEVELSIMELRDELEEEGLDEDAIDARCDALRAKLLEKAKQGNVQAGEVEAFLGTGEVLPTRVELFLQPRPPEISNRPSVSVSALRSPCGAFGFASEMSGL